MTKLLLVLAVSLVAITGAASASSSVTIVPLHSVGGTAPKLALGAPGRVVVVTTGPEQSDNTIPIVLRNNTNHNVTEVKIAATAYVKKRLAATGSDQGIEPTVIAPHGLAIAYVYLGSSGLPKGAVLKFSVASEVAGSVSGFDPVDLPIKTANYSGGKLVGIAHNSTRTKVSGPLRVYGTCFSGTRIVAMESGFSDADDAAAGADAPFTLDFTDFGTEPPPHCSRVLVGMSGYSF